MLELLLSELPIDLAMAAHDMGHVPEAWPEAILGRITLALKPLAQDDIQSVCDVLGVELRLRRLRYS